MHKRPAKSLVLVIIFIAVISILTASTVTIISRYQQTMYNEMVELRERVYDGD